MEFKRKFKIDDTYRTILSERVAVHSENIDGDLISITSYRDNLINDIMKLSKELREAKKEFNKVYHDKWVFYTEKSDLVPENEKEKISWIMKEPDVCELQDVMSEIECEITFLQDMKEVFRDKSWTLKNIIEWRKFQAGE